VPVEVGPVSCVKVRELQHSGVLKVAGRLVAKQVRQFAATFEIEIHRQEGDVVCDVDETETVVELDAIEDRQCLRRDVNVVEVEIAMTVADPVLLNSLKK